VPKLKSRSEPLFSTKKGKVEQSTMDVPVPIFYRRCCSYYVVSVLFVCTGNAARSQMAEGWLKSMKPGLTVQSAGTNPERLSSRAVKAMLEIGLDISDQVSKYLDDVPWKEVDYAITLCGSANEICVTMDWPEKCVREHWPIADPGSDDEYIKARDEIRDQITDFVNRMI